MANNDQQHTLKPNHFAEHTMEKPNIPWRTSKARAVLLEHLSTRILPLTEEELSTDDAWNFYRYMDGFEDVGYSQFKRQLKAHRGQVSKKLNKPNKQKKNLKGGSKTSGNIDWRKSLARIVLLDGLTDETIPLDEKELSAEEAWELYKDEEGFKGVVDFDQFKRQLKAHRDQVSKQRKKSNKEQEAFEHDLKLYPRRLHNHKGQLKFDYSDAKLLLREDVEQGNHNILSLTELWEKHDAYQLFTQDVFAERLKQAVKRKKFVYWMNLKREKKLRKAGKATAEAKANIEEDRAEKENELAQASAERNGKRLRSK